MACVKAGCVGSGCRSAEQPCRLKRRNRVSRLGGLIDCDVMRDDQSCSAVISLPVIPISSSSNSHGHTTWTDHKASFAGPHSGRYKKKYTVCSDKVKPIRSGAGPSWSSTGFYHQCAECTRHPSDHFGMLRVDLQPFLSWFCMGVCIFSLHWQPYGSAREFGTTHHTGSVTLMQ